MLRESAAIVARCFLRTSSTSSELSIAVASCGRIASRSRSQRSASNVKLRSSATADAADVDSGARAGEAGQRALRVADEGTAVVGARGEAAGELEEILQILVARRELVVRAAELLVRLAH